MSGLLRRLQGIAADALRGTGGEAPFALLGFPDHANVGDSAIWLGTTAYFSAHRGRAPRYVSSIDAFSEATLQASALRNSLARLHVLLYPHRMHYPSTAPLRLSSVNVLTDLGWCAGTFHVPDRQSLVDFLGHGNHIVKRVNLGRVTGVAEWVNQQV